jgi:hypothetical protein
MASGGSINDYVTWARFTWIIGIFVVLCGGLFGFLSDHAISNKEKLIAIEASRFTIGDGKQLSERISAVEARVSAVPKEIPPPWFYKQVERLDQRVQKLEDRERKQ